MILHAQVDVAVVVAARAAGSANHEERSALLSAAIAAGGLPGLERRQQPVGELGTLLLARGSKASAMALSTPSPARRFALRAVILPFAMPGISLAPAAGMRCGAPLGVNERDLPVIRIAIGSQE